MPSPSKDTQEPRLTPWVVPLRRVFPWWYLAGFVVSFGVTLLVVPSVSGVAAFWGPTIGIAIRGRQFTAYRRKADGRSLDRRDLVGPRWLEPTCAALLALFAVGMSLSLAFLFGEAGSALLWTGVGLIAMCGVTTAALVLVLRARKRKRRSVLS